MQRIHVPPVDSNYWAAILLASVFGTNLGDYYAHQSGLGLMAGVVLLAALTAPLFVLERFDKRSHTIFYWLVIIIIRTGATNIADYLQFRAHVPRSGLCLALAGFIAVFAVWQQRTSAARGVKPGRADRGLPDSGAPYWLAMLGAGVFGTVLGDYSSSVLGLRVASVGLTAAFAVALRMGRRTPVAAVAVYWVTVAIARTAGTAIGDWMAESKDLDIGLSIATVISGVAFFGLVVSLQSRRPRAA